MPNNLQFVFFGTSEFSVYILDELKDVGMIPALVVTIKAKPQGRGLKSPPSPVKKWADKHKILVIEPENIKNKEFEEELIKTNKKWDLFIVASYGKIFPTHLLDLPTHKTLNVHPSLLPLLRGAAPLEHTILNDMKETGVTIMCLDEEVDHGPIISERSIRIDPWPIDKIQLEKVLGELGGKLLRETMPLWSSGKIKAKEQDHTLATYAPKIKKEDALIDLTTSPYKNLLKIRAYSEWPKTYFHDEYTTIKGEKKKIRIIITEARIKEDGALEIIKIIPEGKKEMLWKDYLRGKV